jgi:RNA polymerase sigma-70 factor (ECF subfamily)
MVRNLGATMSVPGAALVVADGAGAVDTARAEPRSPALTLADVYRENFSFVWRLVRRLGVADAQVEDAVQDVFIVVHRRLADFEGRSSVKTWLAGVVRRVVHDYRRTEARKPALGTCHAPQPVDDLSADRATPEEDVMATEAAHLLHTLLDGLDDDKREVFVLAELEQWSVAEIAEATGLNVNTASSRLRLAREAFEEAAERLRARDAWRFK